MGHVNAEASSSRVTLNHPRAPKVAQVDADELDEGLVQMLGERVEKAVGNFKVDWTRDLRPEIGLIIKLVIFKYSFFENGAASPGASLQNLKLVGRDGLRPSRKRLLLLLLLHPPIFPSYILTRLRESGLSNQWPDLPNDNWRRRAWKVIVWMENAARVWELGGWAMLLWDGRYPSLLMRALGLRLVPSSPHLAKLVSYEFMNRQLVWNAFTEFAMFAFPLLPRLPSFFRPSTLLAPIQSILSQPKYIDYSSIGPLAPLDRNDTKASTAAHSGPLADLHLDTCPICHLRSTTTPVPLNSSVDIALPPVRGAGQEESNEENRIFVPAQTDCWGGCKWCYYCIMGEPAAQQNQTDSVGEKDTGASTHSTVKWDCLRCGGRVTRAWRAKPDPVDTVQSVDESTQPLKAA